MSKWLGSTAAEVVSTLKIATPPAAPAGFRASWERLGAPRKLALAVSGGSDSMALMRFAAPLRDRAEIHVATVDHGLRAGSRQEAEAVARDAASLGLAHSTLQWVGDKPATGLPSAARSARYRLLAEFAIATGAEAIMTAHTADDQAETVLMRMARGSGWRGLAGMAEDSLIAAGVFPPVRLLRPLLRIRRDDLRRFLQSINVRWIDDPTNDDMAFERARVRRRLSGRDGESVLSVDALVERAHAARRIVEGFDALDDEIFRSAGEFDERGGARLDASRLSAASKSLAARLVHAVGGGDYPPNDASLGEALAAALDGRRATLGGVVLARKRQGLHFWREPAAVLGRAGVAPIRPVELEPGERVLWDHRFIVGNTSDQTAVLAPLGDAARALADANETEEWAAAPGLWIGGELAAFPGGGGDFRPLPEERFWIRVNRYL